MNGECCCDLRLLTHSSLVPCTACMRAGEDAWAAAYLNRADVQEAIHAKAPALNNGRWADCSDTVFYNFNRQDRHAFMQPVYTYLLCVRLGWIGWDGETRHMCVGGEQQGRGTNEPTNQPCVQRGEEGLGPARHGLQRRRRLGLRHTGHGALDPEDALGGAAQPGVDGVGPGAAGGGVCAGLYKRLHLCYRARRRPRGACVLPKLSARPLVWMRCWERQGWNRLLLLLNTHQRHRCPPTARRPPSPSSPRTSTTPSGRGSECTNSNMYMPRRSGQGGKGPLVR